MQGFTLRINCICLLITILFLLLFPTMLEAQEQRVGLVQNEKDAFKGFTLFAPSFPPPRI